MVEGGWAGYGLAVDGMPLGVQLLGVAGSDFDLVGVACWVDGNDLQVSMMESLRQLLRIQYLLIERTPKARAIRQ